MGSAAAVNDTKPPTCFAIKNDLARKRFLLFCLILFDYGQAVESLSRQAPCHPPHPSPCLGHMNIIDMLSKYQS